MDEIGRNAAYNEYEAVSEIDEDVPLHAPLNGYFIPPLGLPSDNSLINDRNIDNNFDRSDEQSISNRNELIASGVSEDMDHLDINIDKFNRSKRSISNRNELVSSGVSVEIDSIKDANIAKKLNKSTAANLAKKYKSYRKTAMKSKATPKPSEYKLFANSLLRAMKAKRYSWPKIREILDATIQLMNAQGGSTTIISEIIANWNAGKFNLFYIFNASN